MSASAPTSKITFDEFVELFGGEIPMEAIDLVWNSPGKMTIAEVRVKLNEMAERRKGPDLKPSDEARRLVEALRDIIRRDQHTRYDDGVPGKVDGTYANIALATQATATQETKP